jgi:RimJ/RimL family protein N-acetyltransferase
MRVYLRSLEPTDVDNLIIWHNDPEVTSSLGGNTFFVSKLREIEWLKDASLNDKTNIRLAICLKEDNKYIGNINLTSVNWINRSAEYSIMLGDKIEWNKGYGSEATQLILKYAFEELNLNRVYLTVRTDNIAAIKMYKKSGFNEEGIQRECIYKNNHHLDMYMMSILKNEY